MTDTKIKRSVILLPVRNLTGNEEFASLAHTIYNVLHINLKNQESLDVIPYNRNDFDSTERKGMEDLIKRINEVHNAETCIISDYYVSAGTLHISITVLDVLSSRIKNCFIKTMPADQGRYEVLDSMISRISSAIAKDLPVTGLLIP
ncbi:MAG: hypothetical protein JXB88_22615 [Spirochaetales bacterium]|nr:hypothetical protein [Spirochaetales bacterium]